MEMKKMKFTAMAMIASLALAGCNDEPSANVNYEFDPLVRIDLSRGESEVASAGQEFAFNFLRETVKEKSGENVLVSPFSMSSVWAMLANGAAGSTRDEIISMLGFEGMNTSDVNSYYSKLFAAFPNHDSSATMEIANGLFQNYDLEVKPSFISVLQEYYAADTIKAGGVDWFPTINAWVKEKTHGHIPELLSND